MAVRITSKSVTLSDEAFDYTLILQVMVYSPHFSGKSRVGTDVDCEVVRSKLINEQAWPCVHLGERHEYD